MTSLLPTCMPVFTSLPFVHTCLHFIHFTQYYSSCLVQNGTFLYWKIYLYKLSLGWAVWNEIPESQDVTFDGALWKTCVFIMAPKSKRILVSLQLNSSADFAGVVQPRPLSLHFVGNYCWFVGSTANSGWASSMQKGLVAGPCFSGSAS